MTCPRPSAPSDGPGHCAPHPTHGPHLREAGTPYCAGAHATEERYASRTTAGGGAPGNDSWMWGWGGGGWEGRPGMQDDFWDPPARNPQIGKGLHASVA